MKNVNLVGQTWLFENAPVVISSGTVVGKKEGEGPLGKYFDVIHEDNWLGNKSFEKAEQKILEEACSLAIRKADLKRDDISFHFSGDLLNQTTSSGFTAKSLGIPYFGIFGACSTSMEGLALASYLAATGGAGYAMASTCSHTNTSEKQFRYPNEYGSQKCDTAQCTVIGGGAVIVGKARGEREIAVTSATVGRVLDFGVADPFNMGAAMAPAAADTIVRHLEDRSLSPDYYDLILTGDLGRVGSPLLQELLKQRGIKINSDKIDDGGKLIYPDNGKFFAGGSGCGCMATVAYGYIFSEMMAGRLKKVLCVATGALLSQLSVQQKETIPCIAHGVSLELSGVE
ncbi:MAG: stage V sporulation protein AD [Bacillota bacterium]|jgi:stage V sporulation protein AD